MLSNRRRVKNSSCFITAFSASDEICRGRVERLLYPGMVSWSDRMGKRGLLSCSVCEIAAG